MNTGDFSDNYPSKQCRDEYIAAPSKSSKLRRDTFNGAMRLTITIGQFFGLNPVIGVLEADSSKLRFSMKSWRCLYSCLTIVGQCVLAVACAYQLFKDYGGALEDSKTLVFFATNCVTTILFLRIATKWPKLCQHISKIEASDPIISTTLVKKCNISCIILLSLAALEHILSDVAGIAMAMICQPEKDLYSAFLLQSFPWIWGVIEFNLPIGVMFQILNIQCTFNWSFANIFVICLSWYMESRIQQHAPAAFWRTMREDYSKATNLVRKIDDVISGVILISFGNNLCFICWQLLHVFKDGLQVEASVCGKSPEERPMMHGFEQVVYFAYSFAFLMGRSLAVSLIAARVHTASKETAKALYYVPSSAYCVEVQRLIDQVHGDTVALTGLQFFNIKRGLVLAITGTVITYELVLMQFTGVSGTVLPTPTYRTLPVSSMSNSTTVMKT